jgi:hypothetical protein
VNGAVRIPLKLTMRDLRTQFRKVRVVAALQVCNIVILFENLTE